MSLRDRFIAAMDNTSANVKEILEILVKLKKEDTEEALVLLSNYEMLGASVKLLGECIDNPDEVAVENTITAAENLVATTSTTNQLVKERHPEWA